MSLVLKLHIVFYRSISWFGVIFFSYKLNFCFLFFVIFTWFTRLNSKSLPRISLQRYPSIWRLFLKRMFRLKPHLHQILLNFGMFIVSQHSHFILPLNKPPHFIQSRISPRLKYTLQCLFSRSLRSIKINKFISISFFIISNFLFPFLQNFFNWFINSNNHHRCKWFRCNTIFFTKFS